MTLEYLFRDVRRIKSEEWTLSHLSDVGSGVRYTTIFLIHKIRQMYGHGQGQVRNNQPMGYPAPGQHPANPQGGYQQQHQHHEGFQQQGLHPPSHQFPVHEMQNNGAAPQQYAQHQGGMLKPPASLMQPPALNVEENMNTNSQFLPQRQTQMAISNNENSDQDNYPQQ